MVFLQITDEVFLVKCFKAKQPTIHTCLSILSVSLISLIFVYADQNGHSTASWDHFYMNHLHFQIHTYLLEW